MVKTMNKRIFLVLFGIGFCLSVFGQTTNITNNTTIIINGDVYYFTPSAMTSSPQPKVTDNGFIGYGRWYGEDAAKAWASIVNWAIEHCYKAEGFTGRTNDRETVYISSVEAKRHGENGLLYGYRHEINIYYWVVKKGERYEAGERRIRTFYFK